MKPDDIEQWAWSEALKCCGDGLDFIPLEYRVPFISSIARALLTARQEGRKEAFEEMERGVSEYVWDGHALSQATEIGWAMHHQATEILAAIRSLEGK